MKLINTLFIFVLGATMLTADLVKKVPVLPAGLTAQALNNPIKVRYTNYRGETAVHTIVPISFYFGSTKYHKEEQWLVRLWDIERDAERIYALKEITEWFVK